MPHPTHAHMMEVIRLPEGQRSPEGSTWVCLSLVGDGSSCCMEGNIPVPSGVMFGWGAMPPGIDAQQYAIDFAMQQRVPVLYVETNARG